MHTEPEKTASAAEDEKPNGDAATMEVDDAPIPAEDDAKKLEESGDKVDSSLAETKDQAKGLPSAHGAADDDDAVEY